MTGVIGHVPNPTPELATALALEAEGAGARWLGLADAFWWRDVWMLLDRVAAATSTLEIGPAMTNPYLRHPFHTLSALATLHEAAPGRVFCGVAAGGSEVTAAAGISRADAGVRVEQLVGLIRSVERGEALDPASGRSLDLVLPRTPTLVAGRGPAMVRAAGRCADRVLLWAIPRTDLARTADAVRAAAEPLGRAPAFVWAPLVRHADVDAGAVGHPAVYAAINTDRAVRLAWGLADDTVADIRSALVSGRLSDAIAMVPPSAVDDLVFDPSDQDDIVATARSLGVSEVAVPGFSPDTVAGHLQWAAAVEAQLIGGPTNSAS